MTEQFRFKGVFPALVTPFDENGVNETQYRELINYVIKMGATGIVPCGTTGEFTSMRFEEKEEAIRIACEAAKGRVPVLAGTGAPLTRDVIKLTSYAAEYGASAALVVTPYFLRPSNREIFEHFERIAENSTIPIYLYNIPQLTGVNITWKLIDGLRDLPGIAGIKDSSGDLVNLTNILLRRPEDFQVIIGHDEVVLPALAAGCDGVILASANIFPDRYIKMEAAIAQGNLKEAIVIQRSIQRTVRIIVNRGGAVAVKAALNMMGIPVGHARPPQLEGDLFTFDDMDELRASLEDLQLIPRGPVVYRMGDRAVVAESYPKAMGLVPDTIPDLTLLHGEARAGEDLEAARVNVVMGLKSGPIRAAIEHAEELQAGRRSAHIIKDLLPLTIFAPMVTIADDRHRRLVYEDAQRAVADAVKRTVTDHIIPDELIPDIAIAVNVFVHPKAIDGKRVHLNNFRAVRFALRRAIEGRPSIEEIIARRESARHPSGHSP